MLIAILLLVGLLVWNWPYVVAILACLFYSKH